MQAAVLTGRRTIEMQAFPDPECGPTQVIVNTAYVGICGTEQHVFNGEFENRVKYPAVLGHEFGGIVGHIGSEVTTVRKGDRVVVDPILSCGMCAACHEGHNNACGSLRLRGIDLPGGMAEQVVCDENQLFLYPESLALEHSPMAELYSIGCHAAVRTSPDPADTVAVFGTGKVGLSIIDVFRSLGMYQLIAVDTIPERLEAAGKLGADILIDASREDPVAKIMEVTGGKGVDKALEAVGHFDEIEGILPPVAAAAEVLRPGGRLTVLGQGPQTTPLFLKPLVWKEIEIIMSRVSHGEFSRAVRMMERGMLHPDILITDIEPLAKTGIMFETLEKEKADHIKVVLKV